MLFSPDDGDPRAGNSADRSAYPHPFKNCIVLGLMLAEWFESKDGKQRFLNEEEAKAALGNDLVAKTARCPRAFAITEALTNIRQVRGRCPALVLLCQPGAMELHQLQREGHTRQYSRVHVAHLERDQLFHHIRRNRSVLWPSEIAERSIS